MNLETGEALVSLLDAKGAPGIVQRAKILFPLSQIGAISAEQRESAIRQSSIYGKYDHAIDRQSAYEDMQQWERQEQARQQQMQQQRAYTPWQPSQPSRPVRQTSPRTSYSAPRRSSSRSSSPIDSMLSTFGREAGRTLFRGLMGLLKG